VNIHIHPRKHPTYTPQNINEHPKTPNLHTARRRGPIHRARIFPLPNPYFHIIKYVYSFHRKHISVRHFVDIYGYEGTINRSPTAANGLLITLLPNWNNVANTPQNIYVQPRNSQRTLMKTPNLHSARRRGRFIVPVSLHCQIRIFPLLNTYIRFIANGCPHLKIRIFKSPHTFLFPILWIYTDMRAR